MGLRRSRSMKTKKRITEVALSLFAQKGYDHVTVDEIVEESKTSKGAFYGHFNSKHEVFLEKFKEIDDFYIKFKKNLSPNISAEEKILKLAIAQMEYLKEELGKDLMKVIYRNALMINATGFLSDTERKLYTILETFIEEGQKSGELITIHTKKELSIIITRIMRGTLYDWFIFKEEIDLVREIENTLSFTLKGLRRSNDL